MDKRYQSAGALAEYPAEYQGLERAILQTVAYADVFDYPLTVAELQRYLVGVQVPLAAVEAALDPLVPHSLGYRRGYVMLARREEVVEIRERRATLAAELWKKALRYGRTIGELPFVQMVAVTGALAVDNVSPGADIDYLIVTEPGRLWLCRAAIIALVRLARRRGDVICPNYLLSEQALVLGERSLYTAHELAQMVPISGQATYQRMRRLNAWSDQFLPNAAGAARGVGQRQQGSRRARRAAEAVLRTPAGGWLERWEMNRKIRKLSHQQAPTAEAAFCADWCKGHFESHGQRTLEAYYERLRSLGLQVEL